MIMKECFFLNYAWEKSHKKVGKCKVFHTVYLLGLSYYGQDNDVVTVVIIQKRNSGDQDSSLFNNNFHCNLSDIGLSYRMACELPKYNTKSSPLSMCPSSHTSHKAHVCHCIGYKISKSVGGRADDEYLISCDTVDVVHKA